MSEFVLSGHDLVTAEGELPIQDLFVLPLESQRKAEGEILPILEKSDHLLRRFGGIETLRIQPLSSPNMRLRKVADEVYALLEGKVRCAWLDLREVSPSYNCYVESAFRDPTLLLAPFGVAFGIQAQDGPALVLRLSTHSLREQADLQQLPWRQRA